MTDFVCIGVAHFLGKLIPERTEVTALRASGFASEIGAEWIDLAPNFDAHTDPVIAVNRALVEVVAAYNSRIPLVFAADCVSSLGMAKGLARPDLGVIWFDAHGDFNTPGTTPSGFLGGMPLAMLVGRGDLHLMEGIELAPIPEANIVITDARDLDPGEAAALRASAITHLPDLNALLTAPLPDKPLYIHLDTDIVNPAEMPGMSYAAPGGPSLAETLSVVKRIAQEGQIAGVLFSLWNDALVSDTRALDGTLALARALVQGVRARA